MATLFNTKIKDTYQSLLKLEDNTILTTTVKNVTDGLGNASPLYMSTTRIGIGTNAPTTTLQIKGSGSTSATSSLLVQNSAGTQLLRVQDNGETNIGTSAAITRIDSSYLSLYSPYIIYQYSHTHIYGGTSVSTAMSWNFGDSVAGTARVQIKGSGTTSSTTALLVQNSSGTTALSVNDAANVLIGTTTDNGYKLNVNGSINIAGGNKLNFSNGSAQCWITNEGLTGLGSRSILIPGTGGGGGFVFYSDGGGPITSYDASGDSIQIRAGSSAITGIMSINKSAASGYGGGTFIYYQTNSNNRMYTFGNPNNERGDESGPHTKIAAGAGGFYGNGGHVYLESGAKGTQVGSVDGNIIIAETRGKVGIGTSSPATELHIKQVDSNTSILRLESASSVTSNTYQVGVDFYSTITGAGTTTSYPVGKMYATGGGEFRSGKLRFQTIITNGGSLTDTMTLYQGNVAIGSLNTTPSKLLEVTGLKDTIVADFSSNTVGVNEGVSIQLSAAAGAYPLGVIKGIFIANGGYSALTFSTSTVNTPTEAMRITSGQNVLIGTTTDSGYKLDVNGSTRVKGNTLTVSASGLSSVPANYVGINFDDNPNHHEYWFAINSKKDLYGAIGIGYDRIIFPTMGNDNSTWEFNALGSYSRIKIAARNNTAGNFLELTNSSISFCGSWTVASIDRTNRKLIFGNMSTDVHHIGVYDLVIKGAQPFEGNAGGSIANGGNVYVVGGTPSTSPTGNYGNVILAHDGTAARGSAVVGGTTPAASAIVDVQSTTKGFLPPRMTSTQRNAISSPATGLQVYDTTQNAICEYTGTAWRTISGGKQILNATTGATTIDLSLGNVTDVTLTLSTVITLSNPTVGTYVIKLIQDSIGGKTVSWPFNVLWSGSTPPTLTSTANRTDVITLIYDGVNYYGTYALNF